VGRAEGAIDVAGIRHEAFDFLRAGERLILPDAVEKSTVCATPVEPGVVGIGLALTVAG
jgi:hypothetical protein